MRNNILVVDDNEKSIEYKKSSVKSYYNPLKINKLDDLLNINDDINIMHYETTNCLQLILNSGKEISLHEYKRAKVRFIKLIDDKTLGAGNEIIISVDNNFYIDKKRWQRPELIDARKKDYLIPYSESAANDFNGYENTQNILSSVITKNLYEALPAAAYCNNLTFKLHSGKYNGYLPSIGQLIFLQKYINPLNKILKAINKNSLDCLNTDKWQSSNEADIAIVWVINNNSRYKELTGESSDFESKNSEDLFVLPFFKKIK